MKWLKCNSLSIVFLFLFIISFIGQSITGRKEFNKEMQEDGGPQLTMGQYISSGHFIEATFENFESEFLQMALFVVFTIFLYQKGSSESKDPGKENDVDKEPDPKRKGAPWPVKRGGAILALYKNSLSIVLFLLFIASFFGHFYGSLNHYNLEQTLKGSPTEDPSEYLRNSKFWFESFQNWQSEFLSLFALLVLSIYLRQKGSAQSKAVDAPHSETGE
ncbi:MAG: hypothetical protein JWR72_3376 [Flavisolibacter sp.]|jgi:hypothetical protein|nr:hypothetical protein [Flavisolibacter sp.]